MNYFHFQPLKILELLIFFTSFYFLLFFFIFLFDQFSTFDHFDHFTLLDNLDLVDGRRTSEKCHTTYINADIATTILNGFGVNSLNTFGLSTGLIFFCCKKVFLKDLKYGPCKCLYLLVSSDNKCWALFSCKRRVA